MNIQEAKALALEAFKKELKEPGWELYEHGIAKGPWVAFPLSNVFRYRDGEEEVHVLMGGTTVFCGKDPTLRVTISDVRDYAAGCHEENQNRRFINTIRDYLSKHPLEAP